MKKIIFLPILFACVTGYAQLTLKRADKYFSKYNFEKSAYFYKAFLFKKDDAYAQLQLAKIYAYVNNSVETVRWYKEVIDRNDLEPIHYLNYAQALSSLSRYQEALPYYEKYKGLASDKLLAEEKVYGINHINDFFQDSALYQVKNLDFNSIDSDFAPMFYGDSVVFSSARSTDFGLQRKFSWNNKNYLDLFYVGKEGKVAKFDKNINSKYHEGSIAFSPDKKTAYFTRNNYNNGKFDRSKKGVNMINMYSATLNSHGKWSSITPFKYNSNDYSTGEPSVSLDGNTLYFISDKPEGFGGTDIYKCTWAGTDWSEPINLGHKVNTESNERTPFISEEGILYFASEGHFGLGGLDSYMAEISNGSFLSPKNMGSPINSASDDFGLILNPKKVGYFASDRVGGKGDDDIYGVHVNEQPLMKITGNSFWRTDEEDIYSRKSLSDVKISVQNINTGTIQELYSDELGGFELNLNAGSKYEVIASKENLINSAAFLDLTKKHIKKINPIEMILVKNLPKPTKVPFEFNIVDNANNLPMANTSLFLLNSKTKKVQKLLTDEFGKYKLDLEPNTEYVVKSAPKGYLVNCVSFGTTNAVKETQTTAEPLKLRKLELNQKMEVKNVLYDVNKYEIRSDAALELNKVVQFIKDNPSITVELGAHTDARGSSIANTTLSTKRAQAARDYIVAQGVSSNNISFKGYGESQLLNLCKDGVTCLDELHAQNRRTEIKVTGINKNLVSDAIELNETTAFDKNRESMCNRLGLITK